MVAPVPVEAEGVVLATGFVTVTTGFFTGTGCLVGGFVGVFVVPVPATVVVVVPEVVVVVVVGAVAARHVGTVMVLSSSVTAPVWASARPSRLASVFKVIEVSARIVPTKLVDVPSVAELPTVQKTLHACAPPSRTTELAVAVVSDEPAWKMKTASGSPPAFNVTDPVSESALADRYTPGTNVVPPRVPAATVVKGVSPEATPKAAVEEVCAANDAASAAPVVPDARPGGNPVMDVPGDRPTSPVMTLEPVLVTVVPASTA
jgi:hypothetical protein